MPLVQLAPSAMQRFCDNNSNPLAGGQLFTYAAGTTTPQATYTDNTGTTQNTNPVILNARGEASVWLQTGQAYKLVLQDANGNMIWTQDQINSLTTGSGGGTAAPSLGLVVSSIAALRLIPKNSFPTVFVTGYYSFNDGGGGTYTYDPSDTTSADNGGTIIVAADGGRWKLEIVGEVSVKQFGAKGNGTTDDTASLQACYTWAASAGVTAFHPDGTFCSTGLTAACALNMAPMAQLLYIGADNGTLLNVTSTSLKHGVVRVYGNAKNVMPIQISGNSNDFLAIYSGGVTATATGAPTIVGVGIYGNSNTIGSIRVINMVNAGHPNVSFPQAVLAFGDQNTIDSIIINDSRSGLIISNPVTVYVNSLICRNMADNGIYHLAGVLRLGRLEYAGSEEPAVFEGTLANVGEISIIGTALGVGFQNCGDVSIGRLSVRPDTSGNSAEFLFRTRGGNTSCGRIDIGRITGQFTGTTLWAMNVGTVAYLAIGGVDVQFLYNSAVCTSPGSFGDLTGCLGLRWENTLIEIIDVNNVISGTIFQITAPTVTKFSAIHDIDFKVYASDGVTISSGAIRGVSFAQAMIEVSRVYWRTDIGPYIVGSSSTSGPMDSGTAAPTAGTWNRGKILWTSFPSASGNSGWVCTAAGTPGTWKTFGTIGP